jgi:tRNA1(Val) A37 N6-methylase TrmN6
VSEDRFLDGRVIVTQPDDGFRAGIDAVLLAAALDAKPGERLIELGCGAGTASLCAASRLTDCQFAGFDIDPEMVTLAQCNAGANAMADRVAFAIGDVADPAEWGPADQVFFNPPFFDDPNSMRAPKAGKTRAYLTGHTVLADWIAAARKTLKPRGRLTVIHRADRLGDLLFLLNARWGDVVVKPVHPRAGAPAKRVIVAATRDAKGPLSLLPPLVLHDGEGGQYSAEADAILRGRGGLQL